MRSGSVKLTPERVYITQQADHDPLSRRRIEAMLTTFEAGEVSVVGEAELDAVVRERGWHAVKRWGAQTPEEQRDPDIVFTTAKFDGDEARRIGLAQYPNLGVRDLLGYQTLVYREDGEDAWREKMKGIVCQPAYQLHSMIGCPFRCRYCGMGGVIRILTNMEEYCEQLREWVAIAPEQRLYKWDNQADVNHFEPEYDASRLLVEFFAGQPDRYLEIYAGKSDNVDYLLNLPHEGHTILQWSIAGRTQTEVFEPRTSGWDQRIEAARKCEEAGYVVRFRFSPIIPVANWREDNRDLIDLIFERTRPDVISLCAFGWMGLEDARSCLPFDLLDPEFVAAMEAAEPFLRERGFTAGGGRPIPHDARAVMFRFLIDEIRRHSPDQVIALCLETEEMWRLFERDLRQGSRHYVCNCGGQCTPGADAYERMVNV